MTEIDYDIFKDHNILIKIWENERITRNFNTTLIWENIKFFVGLLGALLGAHMALLGFIWTIKENFTEFKDFNGFRTGDGCKLNTYTSMRKVYRMMNILGAILIFLDIVLFIK